MEEQKEKGSGRDPLRDLEARIDAAIEEVRPKVKRALEELDARVDSAVEEMRPRFESAMEDVRPRVDRFLADVQPRLDSALERIQAKISELRKDLEERAAQREKTETVALPRTEDSAPEPPNEQGGEAGTTPPDGTTAP